MIVKNRTILGTVGKFQPYPGVLFISISSIYMRTAHIFLSRNHGLLYWSRLESYWISDKAYRIYNKHENIYQLDIQIKRGRNKVTKQGREVKVKKMWKERKGGHVLFCDGRVKLHLSFPQ